MSGNSVVNNIFQSMGIRNKGIGGLASGLDTDSLMEAMTITTRSKIAAQQQKKQLLNWRMTAYRSTASTIRTFRDKYLDVLSGSNNMRSSSFYNTFKATSSSDKVTVTASSGSSPVDFSIDKIHQLATSQRLTSGKQLSAPMEGGEFKLTYNSTGEAIDFTNKTLNLTVDGVTKRINLEKLQGVANDVAAANAGGTPMTQAQIDERMQAAFNEIMDDNFGLTQNRLIDTNDDGTADTVYKDYIQTAAYQGLSAEDKEAIDSQVRTINVSVDGGKITLDSQYNRVSVNDSEEVLFFDGGYPDNKTTTNQLLGFDAGTANRVDMGTSLRELLGSDGGLGAGFAGEVYKFKINGVEFTAGADESLATIMERVNVSTANVRMAYDSASDSITLTSKVTGAGQNLQIEDVYGNLMNNLFGSASSEDVAARNLTVDNIESLDSYNRMSKEQKLEFVKNFDGRSFNMTIGSTTKAVVLRTYSVEGLSEKLAEDEPPSMEDIVAMLNAGLDTAFGRADAPGEPGSGNPLRKNVEFALNDDGDAFVLDSSDPNASIKLEDNKASTARDLLGALGFEADNRTNVVDLSASDYGDTLLSDVGVTGTALTLTVGGDTRTFDATGKTISDLQAFIDGFDADPADPAVGPNIKLNVADIINQPTNTPDRKTDYRLVLDTDGQQVSGSLMEELFGVSAYQSQAADDYGARMERGQNAEIEVDGNTLSFETNTFTLNGAAVTVHDVTAADETINIKVEANPDELIEKIEGFITDYNTMIESLNTMIYEESKEGYTPLSDEQKADMSADEIEKWENEAKKGILRSDSTLRGIVDDLRNVFYQKVDSIGLAGYDLGISTKSVLDGDMLDNGKIELSEKGKERLRMAVEQNPDSVREVFMNEDNGIANKLWEVLDNAVNDSSLPEQRGTLVRIAGTTALTADNTSNLGDQIDSIDQKLTTLRARLESEYNRYWKQFSSLEVAISRLNSQSSLFQ